MSASDYFPNDKLAVTIILFVLLSAVYWMGNCAARQACADKKATVDRCICEAENVWWSRTLTGHKNTECLKLMQKGP